MLGRFPVGQVVLVKHRKGKRLRGVVVGHARKIDSPIVLRDGRKFAIAIHPFCLETPDPEPQIEEHW